MKHSSDSSGVACDAVHEVERSTDHAVRTQSSQDWCLSGRPHETASIQTMPVSVDRFLIGRHGDNHLSIYNETVSGHHAELFRVHDDVFVKDLNSTNGTLLNGRRISGVTPLCDGDILHFGNAMYALQNAAQNSVSSTVMANSEDDAVAQVQFSRLISEPAVEPFLQPVVRLEDGHHVGYEVLARSRLIGLESPDKMFRIAGQRDQEAALSRVCRLEGLATSEILGLDVQYYVNTHPCELGSSELLSSLTELRNRYFDAPIMLEIHESAATSTDYLRALRQELTNLDIGLAYDDFGAGQARLMELFEVPPDVLKFDIKFTRGLALSSPQRRSSTASLIHMVQDLGVVTLAEGVETDEEADVCRECGFELAQGYLFGRPQAAKHWADS